MPPWWPEQWREPGRAAGKAGGSRAADPSFTEFEAAEVPKRLPVDDVASNVAGTVNPWKRPFFGCSKRAVSFAFGPFY